MIHEINLIRIATLLLASVATVQIAKYKAIATI